MPPTRRSTRTTICALEEVDGLGCWWLKLSVPGVKPVDADSDGALLRDAVAGHETLDLAGALEAMSYRDDTLPDGISIGDISPYRRLEAISRGRADAGADGLAGRRDRRRGSEPIHDQRHGAGARDRRVEPRRRRRRGPVPAALDIPRPDRSTSSSPTWWPSSTGT